MRPAAVLAIVLAATAGLLVGCGGGDDGTADSAPTVSEDRIAELTALRDALGPPVGALATAEQQVTRAMEALRTEPPDAPADRLAAVGSLTEGTIAELEAARQDLAEATLPDAAPAATAPAVRRAVGAAGDYVRALDGELAVVRRAAEAGRDILELTEAWVRPGSFSEQLERLDAAAAAAEELAGELRAAAETATPCGEILADRAEVAAALPAISAELAELVQQRQGEEFAAQGEQQQAGIRSRLAQAAAGCPHAPPEVVEPRSRLATALYDLERILNPPDLVFDPW